MPSKQTQIGLIGFGDFGEQIKLLLSREYKNSSFTYFDDVKAKAGLPGAVPFNGFSSPEFSRLLFFVCLGYNHSQVKSEIIQKLLRLKRKVPSLIHPTAHVDPSSTVGPGCIILPMCNIDQKVKLGAGVVLNNSVVVSHESAVGDCAYLSPGVVVSGCVAIGRQSFIGTGALISDHVTIGERARIGIGTTVTADVPAGKSAVGNPMKITHAPLKLGR